MSNWNRCVQQGAFGENVTKQCLYQIGWEVKDLTGDWKKYGKKGDFLVDTGTKQNIFIDVKTDLRIADTGNVCLEGKITRSDGKQHDGWLATAKYDYIVFVSPQKQIAYIASFPMLKANSGIIGKIKDTPCLDGEGQYNRLYVMPIQQLCDLGIIVAAFSYNLIVADDADLFNFEALQDAEVKLKQFHCNPAAKDDCTFVQFI